MNILKNDTEWLGGIKTDLDSSHVTILDATVVRILPWKLPELITTVLLGKIASFTHTLQSLNFKKEIGLHPAGIFLSSSLLRDGIDNTRYSRRFQKLAFRERYTYLFVGFDNLKSFGYRRDFYLYKNLHFFAFRPKDETRFTFFLSMNFLEEEARQKLLDHLRSHCLEEELGELELTARQL